MMLQTKEWCWHFCFMVIMSFHIQRMGRIVMQVLMKLLVDAMRNIGTLQYSDRKQYKLEFEAAM